MTKLLNQLDCSTSAGVTDIPTRIIKVLNPMISLFLVELFNDCLKHGFFPDEFKLAIITPLYKRKGSIDDLNNYRAISILPPIA